ncbi:MAG: LacI family DNA-binding transcriptional regulator [Lachnospiraceae bacterium]|nr:LacI family DNA-binding transcriptional regulator [Lachnospiraceae bacterium]MDE6625129.1 LacI family DNA-binding transcriptional regulator [Lachnospiraceae bacterium]
MVRKQVTMKDVATELDVSIVTVSKALAGKEGVSESLREKIISKANELGYVFKSSKKQEERGSLNIALLISERFIDDGDSFYFKIYQKIIMRLSEKGFIGILEIVRSEDENKGILPNVVHMDSVEQVIVIGEMKTAFLEQLTETGLGIVFFDFENEEFDVDCVIGDSSNGGFLLTRYLVKHGYKRIGFVGDYKSTRSILDRYMGYRKYLIAKDQSFNEEWTVFDRDEKGKIKELILPKEMPEAFVCNCDVVAYRLIDTLKKAGYSVPEDIAVVGYDDYADRIPEGVELTTYRVNTDEMIRQCIHIVERRVRNRHYRRGTTVIYGDLIERKTVKII